MHTAAVPDEARCEVLLKQYGTPEHVRRHCRAVAEKACSLAEGRGVNIDLLRAAAMLHDIARIHKDHAAVGAEYLKEQGFPEVAEIIAIHHELPLQEEFRISEKSLLFLADKLVLEDRECTLEERFLHSAKKVRSPEGLQKHELRFRQAGRILDLLDSRSAGFRNCRIGNSRMGNGQGFDFPKRDMNLRWGYEIRCNQMSE